MIGRILNFGRKKATSTSLNSKNRTRANAQLEPSDAKAGIVDGLGNSFGRTSLPPIIHGGSPSDWERRQLIDASRFLYTNDGVVKGAIDDLARYSFPLKPQANTDNPDWNNLAESYFETWSSYYADVKNRLHFGDLQRLASIQLDRDGDVGILFVKKKGGGLCVQIIESDKIISHPKSQNYPSGVRYDAEGKPMSFCIREDNKNGFRIIPASSMLLLLEPERADQIRGLSALVHAVGHIRDKRDILGFEKQGVKNLASISAVLESDYEEPEEDAWGLTEEEVVNGDTTTDVTLAQMQSGAVPVLRKGEKLNSLNQNRPSPTFQGFLEFLVREFAVGMGLPFEFVWDTHGLTGPSQRFVMGKAQRKFSERQRLFYPFIRKSWQMVIDDGINQGRIPKQKGWNKIRIQTPAKLTIDVGREAQQEREDVKMGLMSYREHYGKRGLDWQSEMDQKAKEAEHIIRIARKVAEAGGCSLDFAVNLVMQTSVPLEKMEQQADTEIQKQEEEEE
jgi:capsid protein